MGAVCSDILGSSQTLLHVAELAERFGFVPNVIVLSLVYDRQFRDPNQMAAHLK